MMSDERLELVRRMISELSDLRQFVDSSPDEMVVNYLDWEAFRVSSLAGWAEPGHDFDPLVMWGLPVTPSAAVRPGEFFFRQRGSVVI